MFIFYTYTYSALMIAICVHAWGKRSDLIKNWRYKGLPPFFSPSEIKKRKSFIYWKPCLTDNYVCFLCVLCNRTLHHNCLDYNLYVIDLICWFWLIIWTLYCWDSGDMFWLMLHRWLWKNLLVTWTQIIFVCLYVFWWWMLHGRYHGTNATDGTGCCRECKWMDCQHDCQVFHSVVHLQCI